jgi:DNA invertase Pin-like site-specific DNA recombinase
MTTAIYLRVSTDMQDTAHQRAAIDTYCVSRGFLDVSVYEDNGISGATLTRPAFQRLLNDVKTGKIQTIVTFEWSRLTRDMLDGFQIMSVFKIYGVVVEIPGQGIVPFDSAIDKLLVAIKGFAAEQERESIRARIRSGIKARRDRGEHVGAPLGNQNRTGYRKPLDTDLVNKLAALRAEGLSIRAIAAAAGIDKGRVCRLLKVG